MADSLAVPGSAVRRDAAALWRLYVDEGMTIAAVATRLGVTLQTVHNWLVAAGVPRRPSPAAARNDIRDDQIVRLYTRTGYTAAEIAERLGCSTSLVYFRLERRGIVRRARAPRGGRGVRPADAELAHRYRDYGLSLRDLAGRYGVSARAVHGWLIAAGIDRRPPGAGRVACDGADPVALYQAGWSAPAIADRVGCSPSIIYRRLDVAGVARRPVSPQVSCQDLLEALDDGLSAPDIASALGVSVTCVCRALAREQLMTNTQAARHPRRLRYPELYYSPTRPAANVSVSGNT
jgi:transposase